MAIPKERSIVKVDKRPYRKIAQENWGLTDEQMRGKHVHHRIARSDGGTNDPSNLYVCSPSMHKWGWHNGEEWIEWAVTGGKLGGPIGGKIVKEKGIGIFSPGMQSEGGKTGGPRGVKTQRKTKSGLFGLTKEQRSEITKKQWKDPAHREMMQHVGKRSGRKVFEEKIGAFAKENLGKGAKVTNSTLWVDPEHPELGAHHFNVIKKLQRQHGYPDTRANRVKLSEWEGA